MNKDEKKAMMEMLMLESSDNKPEPGIYRVLGVEFTVVDVIVWAVLLSAAICALIGLAAEVVETF